MQELKSPEATFESQHAHTGVDGAPKAGLERWWETPAMEPPPPPNPAIYGLDEAEVSIDEPGSESIVIDDAA
jgi:hypothetical protein